LSRALRGHAEETAGAPVASAVEPPNGGVWPAGARTIAVLPFTNLSPDPEENYLVDGLTEELIGVLSRVRELRVAARTSAFAYKGANRDIREIGREMDVGAILEGSVQRVGDRIRVHAQLIDVADGFHLWSEAYDRDVTDMFAVQRDLALRIASALQASLSPAERQLVTERRTVSPEAFALYLKGRHFWNQRTSIGFDRARDYYQRAIAADPGFAQAHAGLATTYSLQGLWGDLSSAAAGERVRAAATRAVELDDALAEAHAALGVYLHVYAWDSEAAEREQRRAIDLDPRLVIARYFYGNLLRAHGRLDEALAQHRTALEIDPLDLVVNEAFGKTLILADRVEEASAHFQGALELDSLSWSLHAGLGASHEAAGRYAEALNEFRRASDLGGPILHVARLLARVGREEEARDILAKLREEAGRTGIHNTDVATVFYALHDVDGALDWLEQALRERTPGLRFIHGRPEFKGLDAEPRYRDLLRRIGVVR
jgi:serine/threonine-protein kinase